MNYFFVFLWAGVLWTTIWLSSCTEEDLGVNSSGTADDSISVNSIYGSVQQIFNDNCIECHAEQSMSSLDLREENSYAQLVNVGTSQVPEEHPTRRVIPGFPDSSYLYQKISSDLPKDGDRMPLNQPALPQADIDIIATWIACGAPSPTDTVECPKITTHRNELVISGVTLVRDTIKVDGIVKRVDTLSITMPPGYFDDYVQPVFDDQCITCHAQNRAGWLTTGGADNGLDLTSGNSYDLIVNVESWANPPMLRVKPEGLENSFLYLKLFPNPPEGDQMPIGSFLNEEKIAPFKFWILTGASRN